MNDPLDRLQKESKSLKLSDAERSAMRAELLSYMSKKPIAPQPVRSPFLSFYRKHTFAMTFASIALIILLAGSTITYAARNAVPGDILYPIRKNVQEPIAVFLGAKTTLTTEKKSDESQSEKSSPQQSSQTIATTTDSTQSFKKNGVPAVTVNTSSTKTSSTVQPSVKVGITTSTSTTTVIQASTTVPLISATTSATIKTVVPVPQASVEVNTNITPVQNIPVVNTVTKTLQGL